MQEITIRNYETALKNGISRFNVYQRVHTYGWSIQKAITKPVRGQKTLSMEYWIKEARNNNIPYHTFMNRIKSGWGTVKAATKQPGSGRGSSEDMGKFQVISKEDYAIAKAIGLTKALVKNRVYNTGWTVERAITQPHASMLRDSASFAKAEANGVNIATYRWRIRKGWSKEDAATVPAHGRSKTASAFAEFNVGEQDIKIAEMYGISRKALLRRLRANWPIDVAATMPPVDRGDRKRFGLELKKQEAENLG